jgi:hypothetical protein
MIRKATIGKTKMLETIGTITTSGFTVIKISKCFQPKTTHVKHTNIQFVPCTVHEILYKPQVQDCGSWSCGAANKMQTLQATDNVLSLRVTGDASHLGQMAFMLNAFRYFAFEIGDRNSYSLSIILPRRDMLGYTL